MSIIEQEAERLVAAHGGDLVQLLSEAPKDAETQAALGAWPSWTLTARQTCGLELLLNGGFSPLTGFMSRDDYESVCESMRLTDGTLWTIPVTLDVDADLAGRLAPGATVALRDAEGAMLAALDVEDVWMPDRIQEATAVFGTRNRTHPGVAHLLEATHPWYVGGTLRGCRLPHHHDFRALRLPPASLRAAFARTGWDTVVAFQTRNPIHRAHFELTLQAAAQTGAKLLIHPVVGATKPGDVDHYTRVQCYRAILPRYPKGMAKLALLPLAMRMAGPREAVLHAIIRKNYGCTHFIVGRDHASPGVDEEGRPFYGPYDAQDLMTTFEAELGVKVVTFPAFVYAPDSDRYLPSTQVPPGTETQDLSGTRLRELLSSGEEIPSWYTFPEVANVLRARQPARASQGVTIFFTGLSGSGKSTIAKIVESRILEAGVRRVSMLDGDEVRHHLSSELGFSREHRDLNVRRIGYVASEVTRHGGVAICAPIAPYDQTRKAVRAMVETYGGFVLVHVATSLAECERRDRKGLYAKARAGLIKEFTGISDPYEVPDDADLVIDTARRSPDGAALDVLEYLERAGYTLGTMPATGAGSRR